VDVDEDSKRDAEALAMAALAGDPAPRSPIMTDWDEGLYESLKEIGSDFEFLDERLHVAGGEPLPRFLDAAGRRYRILVVALEVVLCVNVPVDFDPRELEVSAAIVAGEPAVVEFFRSMPHRGLLAPSERRPEGWIALRKEHLLQVQAPGAVESLGGSPSWLEFDEAWFRAVDPAPPVQLWPIRRKPRTQARGGR
jgi:hypothetical protein